MKKLITISFMMLASLCTVACSDASTGLQQSANKHTSMTSKAQAVSRINFTFSSHQPLVIQGIPITITIYGYNKYMADKSATIIAQKQVSVASVPFSVAIDLPKNPHSLIKPSVSDSNDVRYYLAVETDNKVNANIQLDYDNQSPDLDLNNKKQHYYLKRY